MEKVTTLLKKLGFTADQVAAITAENSDFDVTAGVKAFNTAQHDHYVEIFKNDQDLKKEIEKGLKGKLFGAFRNDIKKRFDLGLSNSELQEMEPHELLDIAAKAKGTGGKGTGEIKALQDENVDLKNKVKELEEVKIPGIRSEVDQAISKVKSERQIRAIINQFSEKKELLPEVDAAFNSVSFSIGSKYDLKPTDKGVELYEKGSDYQKRAQGSIDGKEKLLELGDVIKTECVNFGFIRKNNNTGEPGGQQPPKVITPPKGAPRKVAKGVAAAAARLQEMGAKTE